MKKILVAAIWIVIIFTVIQFQSETASGNSPGVVYRDFADSLFEGNNGKSIAIIGDLQRTSIWELILGREQNDEERENIMHSLMNDDPSVLVLLGDMVFDGSSPEQWEYFDNLLSGINQIPVLPVVGNHDYYGYDGKKEMGLIKSRFPHLKNSNWYTRTYGNTALIFLDSNEPDISPAKWKEQIAWYKSLLKNYESDPAITSILVFTHHPPYTNSIVTGDEKNIQKAFVKPFMDSKKTAAFISGHAHTYERFERDGKQFIISGGGGGPRVFLKKGKDCHEDQCKFKGVRPFHYMLLNADDESISISVKGINKGEDKFFLLDSVKITLPEAQLSSR